MPAWLLLMLPQLIAGLGSLMTSSANVNAQNRYNRPYNQIARLREAGLPYAAFQAGQAGNQSSLPDISGWESIGDSVGTGIAQANQMKMFVELLRKAGFDADMAGFDRDIKGEERDALMTYGSEDPFGKEISLAKKQKLIEFQLKDLSLDMQRNAARIQEIDKLIKDARYQDGSLMKQAKAEFDAIVLKNSLMRQQWKTNDARNAAFNKVIDFMKGSDGKLGFMESLLILFASGISGGVSKGGVNFGF